MHVVNTTIELPEGATMSDNDEHNQLDLNDPHRALDINLDENDDFFAQPRVKKAEKSPTTEIATPKENLVKMKDPEPNSIESETAKKAKKKHKRRKEENEENLLEPDPKPEKERKSKKKTKDPDDKPKKHKKSSKKSTTDDIVDMNLVK